MFRILKVLFPAGSKGRYSLFNIINFFRFTLRMSIFNKLKIQTKKQYFEVVFLPQKDYHLWTMGLIARELIKQGVSSCMMDLTDFCGDEGSRNMAKSFGDIPFYDLKILLRQKIAYKALACMNDWDRKATHPLIRFAQRKNKITIGIIEGINDFHDCDTKRQRKPYQTVEYLLLSGSHDRQFFKTKQNKSYIIGIPRIIELLKETPSFPEEPLAVVNVNFSYGVLEDKRDYWLNSVIEGCKLANIDFIITQHPADKGELTKFNVSNNNMYNTIRSGSIVISRFSSIIIEALAMGKPAIYHNPHGEKANKFQEPMGAYSISDDSTSLSKAIQYELSLKTDYRKRANIFLDYHCNINSEMTPCELAAIAIKDILKQKNQIVTTE